MASIPAAKLVMAQLLSSPPMQPSSSAADAAKKTATANGLCPINRLSSSRSPDMVSTR
ncbi:hypothetical protein D3C72_2200850 [compost metagenome]